MDAGKQTDKPSGKTARQDIEQEQLRDLDVPQEEAEQVKGEVGRIGPAGGQGKGPSPDTFGGSHGG